MKHNPSLLVAALLLLSATAWGQTRGGMPRAAFEWRCAEGDSHLNFNAAATGERVFDSVPVFGEYTLVAVYQPLTDSESAVWRLDYGDSAAQALTTRRILAGATAIRYGDYADRRPVIHTLRQSAPETDTPAVRLMLGDSNIKVAEVLYYDRRLGAAALRRVQSALALRYGVTLGPVDYLAGDGTRIWCPGRDCALFHHRVTGVGVDTVSGLRQLASRSEMEGGMVTLRADSLAPGTFLVFGDNDAPLAFEAAADLFPGPGCEALARRWRVQATGEMENLYTLTFDTRDLPQPADSLVLLVDYDVYRPAAVTAEGVRFDHVFFPTDSSLFTLGRGAALWQTVGSRGHAGGQAAMGDGADGTGGAETRLSLYPNPTTGSYTLEVTGSERVEVTIHDVRGRVVASFSESGGDSHRFEGSLPSGNAYYATVTTDDGTRTLKLVVK